MKLILASSSPARLATLRSAGIEPEVRVAEVDEEQVLSSALAQAGGYLPPAAQVLTLARAKARAVVQQLTPLKHSAAVPHAAPELPDAGGLTPAAFVLGCDSMLEFQGTIMGKPHTRELARERWRQLRGESGVLHTGHWLIGEGEEGESSATRVHFAELTEGEIDAYVATGEPLKVAGAFTIDGLGGPYITRIEGDHHGVVGLSLPLLRVMLARLGVAIHELRNLV